MNIGRMREWVTIQVPSTSASTDGDFGAPVWRRLASVHAEVEPMTIAERLMSQAQQASATYLVKVRYRDGVTEKARIVCWGPDFAGSTMQIHQVMRNRKNGSLDLDCSEVKA